MLLVWDFFCTAAINCFWKFGVVLQRTFKLFTTVVLKKSDWRHGSGFTAAAVRRWLTVDKAEAGWWLPMFLL